MPILNRDHRRLLENTVAQARTIAVDGARKALTDQYAVHHHEPWPHMKPEERELRNQLRAHGRQLGDWRDDRRDTQEIEHLVQACAYEHWHRMLFARFLAENDLLLDAEHGMAMTLEEVRELAREQNRDWIEIAAELAQKMLLSVFRPDDPALRVLLPPETRQQMEQKLATLPAEVFRADDSLGWVYQFWQRDEKDLVNKSEVKIGADELPAVTQLFTEDYMVLFLLENTLGAWWIAKRRAEGKSPALPGYEWTYLRLKNDGSPAAGSFDGWPRSASELRVLDPSMGSGHFLTFALPILARMRMEEEGISLKEALASVLKQNLFGLEIDSRCAQIAAFNLALAAWRLSGDHFPLSQMNLACSGLGIHASEEDWASLAQNDYAADYWMRRLYALFRTAPILGSLIDPTRFMEKGQEAGLERALPLIEEALAQEQSDEKRELAIAAQGVLAAFRILAGRFTLVATNVPYLGRGKQDQVLADYCSNFHSDAKADLATCFVDRCLRSCQPGATIALVTPQNWLYQVYYAAFRQRILLSEKWIAVARLGPRAFQEITGEIVKAALVVMSRLTPSVNGELSSWDVAGNKTPLEKARALREQESVSILQAEFEADQSRSLRRFARCYQGISTGDNPRMVVQFWELNQFPEWEFFQVPSERTTCVGGRSNAIRGLVLSDSYGEGAIRGKEAWGNRGVAIARVGSLAAAMYDGAYFANTVPIIVPNDESLLPAIWTFVTSPEFREAVSSVNQSLSVDNGYLEKIPFDLEKWEEIAAEKFPEGLPKAYSPDPTQWLFDGCVVNSTHPLQVAVARLVGYKWPRQNGSSFPDCPSIDSDALDRFVDSDGIVCLNSIGGEASASDRLRELLAAAYGSAWSAAKLSELLGGISLDSWLRDKFFAEHCQLFQHRPFVWHVWDGRKDGFHALVNYHKLAGTNDEGRKTLEKLVFTYLGRWIERQGDEVRAGEEGADGRLAASTHLKSELERILVGESPYDIFIRWKPLYEQPTGWAPDPHDGVRLNIRPWLATTLAPGTKPKKDACILRVTPKIPYGKDRGKEPHRPKEAFPWFWSWDGQSDDFLGAKDFDGARWNDLHYSLEAKRDARLRVQSQGSSK